MNLEALAMRPAVALHLPDPDEADEALGCERCGGSLAYVRRHSRGGRPHQIKPRQGQRVCTSCAAQGWRSRPCLSCGGVTRSWDWQAKRRGLNGWCQECSAAEHQRRALL